MEDIMDVTEAEQFGALASNWREAGKMDDRAASEAFEDELHASIAAEEIARLPGLGARTGEPSAAETDRLRSELGTMWSNASARLD
jgi:hypothetical protein